MPSVEPPEISAFEIIGFFRKAAKSWRGHRSPDTIEDIDDLTEADSDFCRAAYCRQRLQLVGMNVETSCRPTATGTGRRGHSRAKSVSNTS
jgi:hypothetical protein